MDADVEALVGAGRHERSDGRLTYRNGYRDRTLETRLGSLNLRIPKLRQGTYFPGFLEPRRTVEKVLVSVIQEAWIGGVSTCRVDEAGPGDGHDRDLRCPRRAEGRHYPRARRHVATLSRAAVEKSARP